MRLKRRYQTRKRTPTEEPEDPVIALCIPFDIKDLEYLIQCLKSIDHQTRQPDLVVFSFSRIRPPIQEKLRDLIAKFPLLPTVHLCFSEERQYAGKNRNVAATCAVEHGADILSFIDADDIAHPRRLELIERAFQKHPTLNAVLHGYRSIKKEPVLDFSSLEWRSLRGRLYKDCFRVLEKKEPPWRLFTKGAIVEQDPTAETIQNGHLSLRAAVWKEHPYREDLNAIEDSDYNAHLYKEVGGFALISDALVTYLYGTI